MTTNTAADALDALDALVRTAFNNGGHARATINGHAARYDMNTLRFTVDHRSTKSRRTALKLLAA